jgi:hypothetical protein
VSLLQQRIARNLEVVVESERRCDSGAPHHLEADRVGQCEGLVMKACQPAGLGLAHDVDRGIDPFVGRIVD